MKKLLLTLVILIFILGCAEARLPKVGDYVLITTSSEGFMGNITAIDNGIISLQGVDFEHVATYIDLNGINSKSVRRIMRDDSFNISIGIGAIQKLIWKDEYDKSRYV